MKVPGGHKIIHHTHGRIELDILESPCNAKLGHFMCGYRCDVLTLEIYTPCLRSVEPTDTIQQACLTGPIWSNDSQDFSPPYVEGDVTERLQPAKFEGERGNLYERSRVVFFHKTRFRLVVKVQPGASGVVARLRMLSSEQDRLGAPIAFFHFTSVNGPVFKKR